MRFFKIYGVTNELKAFLKDPVLFLFLSFNLIKKLSSREEWPEKE